MVTSSLPVQVGVILATVAGLWIGARLLVDAVVRLARRVGLSELTVGLTIVAAGTSAPELVVTTDAALRGLGDIAVSNVVGSSIYNLAFILGVLSLLRVVPIERGLVRRDGLALAVGTLLAAAAAIDLSVTRVEGLALAGLFVAYTSYLLRDAGGESSPSPGPAPGTTTRVIERTQFRGRHVAALLGGLALVLVSGDLMVGAAVDLARGVGVSDWVIGGTIVAAGTSTPEFAVSLLAIRRGRLGVSVGNVVGSNLFNLLAIAGLSAALRPLTLSDAALTSIAWLVAVTGAMVAALWTGRRLSRPEGALFAASEVVRWAFGLLR